MSERIPFPEKIINWYDIAKGVGEVVLEFVTERHHESPFIKVTPENVDRLLPHDQTEPPAIG